MKQLFWIAFLCAACDSRTEAQTPQPPPGEAWLLPQQVADSKITLTDVAIQTVHANVAAGGKVTFDDLKVTHVYSPVTGRVTRVLANPGQRVKKGTPLCSIASPDVGAAFSDVAKASADLQAAEHEHQRQEELLAAGAAARKEQENAEDNYRKAKAEYDRARQKAQLLRTG